MSTTDVDQESFTLADLRAHQIRTVDELREINGTPKPSTANKETDFLTPRLRTFINASPFCLIATANADGTCDVAPRGDPPGAIRILDDRALAIPDRLGNRRMDNMQNIITNEHIGMLFLIPDVDETVRLNGRAFITREPDLLESLGQRGRAPNLAIIVEIDQVFMHCARAFLRSGLWKPETWPDPDTGRDLRRTEGPTPARRIPRQTPRGLPLPLVLGRSRAHRSVSAFFAERYQFHACGL